MQSWPLSKCVFHSSELGESSDILDKVASFGRDSGEIASFPFLHPSVFYSPSHLFTLSGCLLVSQFRILSCWIYGPPPSPCSCEWYNHLWLLTWLTTIRLSGRQCKPLWEEITQTTGIIGKTRTHYHTETKPGAHCERALSYHGNLTWNLSHTNISVNTSHCVLCPGEVLTGEANFKHWTMM